MELLPAQEFRAKEMLVERVNLAAETAVAAAVLVVLAALRVLDLLALAVLEFLHLYRERQFNTLAAGVAAFHQIT
jgi:hypothetical protein